MSISEKTANTKKTKDISVKSTTTAKADTIKTIHAKADTDTAKAHREQNAAMAKKQNEKTKANSHDTHAASAHTGPVKLFSMEEARQEIFKTHKERFHNIHMVPKIVHITISACCSRFMNDTGKMTQIEQQLRNITCQQPAKTFARQSNASFKLRQGMHIGFVTTLRGAKASQFLFKLLYINMPRIQDFAGLTMKSFDNNGNYNIGMKDINAFVETNHDLVTSIGLNISIAVTSTHKEDTIVLFKALKFPFTEFLK